MKRISIKKAAIIGAIFGAMLVLIHTFYIFAIVGQDEIMANAFSGLSNLSYAELASLFGNVIGNCLGTAFIFASFGAILAQVWNLLVKIFRKNRHPIN